MKKIAPLTTNSIKMPRPLHTEVQWSEAARLIPLGSLKYVTLEALMRQGARATFFTVPCIHALPPDTDHSTFVVDINVVDDEEMQALNAQYRGKNRPTDVLSFAQLEGESAFASTGGDQVLLGDIIISLPTALRQAAAHQHPLEEELAFLAVHATLHLMGYDHEIPGEKKIMWEHQNAIMARICNWPPNRKR